MNGTKQYRGTDKNGQHVWRLRVWDGTRQVSQTFKVSGRERGVKAADNALEDFSVKVRRNPDADPNRTVSDLWDAFYANLLNTDRLSPTTLYDYWKVMHNKIVPEMGKIKLDDLTSYRLDQFYATELKRVSARTVVKYHRILSSMFRQAERWKWIEPGCAPTRDARAPRAPKAETITPGIEVVRELVQACTDDRMRLMILLAASIGARRGELVALRWSDVSGDQVRLGSSAYELRGGGVALKGTKTNKPRVVSIDPRSSSALEAIRGDGFIFSDDGLTPWRPDHVSKLFAKVRDKVPAAAGVRLHDLRHFLATNLVDSGLPIAGVSKQLGHERTSTTQDIYVTAIDEYGRRAAAIVETWELDR